MSAARWRQRIQYQLAVLPILLLLESNGRFAVIREFAKCFTVGNSEA